ncbi:MAG: transporter [Chryseolinea sp.]
MMRFLLSIEKSLSKGLVCLVVLLTLISSRLSAQTTTDGLMMGKNLFCTGFMYTHDKWTDYWEGELKRENGNIGSITTQSLAYYGVYGITGKLNVIAMLPYVKTEASQGTLHSMEGIQDLSIAVKYNFLRVQTDNILFRAFGVLNFSTPLTDYTPDFLPLSLGAHTTNLTPRINTMVRLNQGWFANVSAGYTFRSNTELDRPSYYDGSNFYNSSEVDMPNVFDVFASAGYQKESLQVELNYIQQNTLGGADIRRQDMPFVSNKMNAQRVGLLAMYYLPAPLKNLAVRGSVHYTVNGRNVGQSTTYLAGILYTFKFGTTE